MKTIYSILITFITFIANAQSVFINEIHYDNSRADVNEGVEIAGPSGTDLSTYSIVLYNGSNGTIYDTETLSGIIPNEANTGYGTIAFPISGIQNGAPDGIALVNGSTLIQFLSYEGSFTAIGGAADGVTSIDIGVSETGTTNEGSSLQLTGNGNTYSDFSWQDPNTSSFGFINTGQTFLLSTLNTKSFDTEEEPIVFPNKGILETNKGEITEVYNILGQGVPNKNLTSGIYIVIVKINGKQKSIKIVF